MEVSIKGTIAQTDEIKADREEKKDSEPYLWEIINNFLGRRFRVICAANKDGEKFIILERLQY